MRQIVEYILRNREWIFSGIGVFVLSAVILIIRWLYRRKPLRIGDRHQTVTQTRCGGSNAAPNVVPKNWQGIVPPQSRYKFFTESKDSIPLGSQTYSFEYGPHGHANALTLKGSIVRAEIQFTCRITNPYKAMFAVNEYALNVLLPGFLSQARGILERFPLTKLRAARQEIAREIASRMSPQFEELGVQLESVTIGALDKIEHADA